MANGISRLLLVLLCLVSVSLAAPPAQAADSVCHSSVAVNTVLNGNSQAASFFSWGGYVLSGTHNQGVNQQSGYVTATPVIVFQSTGNYVAVGVYNPTGSAILIAGWDVLNYVC